MIDIEELDACYDARQSFYGKALVHTEDNGSKTLYSYNVPVVTIAGDRVTLHKK